MTSLVLEVKWMVLQIALQNNIATTIRTKRNGSYKMDKSEKEILFLVFSAGYEAGFTSQDLATAFEQWYGALEKIRS